MEAQMKRCRETVFCGLAILIFCGAIPNLASAQTKDQLRNQYNEIATKLAEMAWYTTCSADIASICEGVKAGRGEVYNCLFRNRAKLTEQCIKTLPLAKPLVDKMSQIRAQLAVFADNPLPKADEDIAKYGEVEGWTIFSNKTRKNCYISRVDGSGAVQMGVTSDQEVGYLGVFTKEDIGIKNGSNTGVVVSIDGNIYAGIATGLKGHIQGGYSGGYILADNPDFKRDLAKRYKMIVFPETKAAFIVDLKGTYKAMAMGRKCIMEQ